MRLLSPLLQRVLYPALGSVGYFHSRQLPPVSVLTYHGVLPFGYQSSDPFLDGTLLTVSAFRGQLKLLKKHYNVISPSRFRAWLHGEQDLPPHAVLLTCDDGLMNNFTVMLPILQEEKLECLFFVTAASVNDSAEMLWYLELYLMLMAASEHDHSLCFEWGVIPGIAADRDHRRALWWDLTKTLSRFEDLTRRRHLDEIRSSLGLPSSWADRYREDLLRQRFQLLGMQELKQLADANMTIGAHTISHPVLAQQHAELASREIAGGREVLSRALHRPIWALAYPFGDLGSVGSREHQLAEQAQYDCAFVNVGGAVREVSKRFALPRIHVTADMSLSVYEAHISGLHDALRDRWRMASGITMYFPK